ncbi:MAG: hypothetical protein ACK4NM_19490, partial [Hydrogenophaga sp.]
PSAWGQLAGELCTAAEQASAALAAAASAAVHASARTVDVRAVTERPAVGARSVATDVALVVRRSD